MIIMYDLCSLMLYILAFYLGLIVWRKVFMDVTRTMMQPTVLMQVTIVQLYTDACYHCSVIYDVHRMYQTVIKMKNRGVFKAIKPPYMGWLFS